VPARRASMMIGAVIFRSRASGSRAVAALIRVNAAR
jgi:hypothetical protein